MCVLFPRILVLLILASIPASVGAMDRRNLVSEGVSIDHRKDFCFKYWRTQYPGNAKITLQLATPSDGRVELDAVILNRFSRSAYFNGSSQGILKNGVHVISVFVDGSTEITGLTLNTYGRTQEVSCPSVSPDPQNEIKNSTGLASRVDILERALRELTTEVAHLRAIVEGEPAPVKGTGQKVRGVLQTVNENAKQVEVLAKTVREILKIIKEKK